MQQFLQFITWGLFTAQLVSGVLAPIFRSSTTAVAASGFTFGCSAVGHGRAGYITGQTVINNTAVTTLRR
jgi:hypothetical protein